MTSLLVGIDGGGTSCRARIRDHQGNLLGEGKSGSANILLGVEVAMASIIDAIHQACQQAGLSQQDYSRMHLGLALAAAEQKSAWHEFMALPHSFASMVLNTDAYGACLGAHNGNDGAIMIAGTGSCGIFIQQGQQHIVGGREFPISDLGGGAIMGLRLIQYTLLSQDGIKPSSPITEIVMQHFDHSIDAIVEWSKTAKPCDYGQFSPQIFACAADKDQVALTLLQDTAADIDMYLVALIKKGANAIALMGGIGERIVPYLSNQTQSHLVASQNDAIEGALMMANHPQHNLYSVVA
ncbi:N-acetylglucosamine kinase [Vibrio rumoiensis]|uniref:N-acetylglucosamine kinase n=1 Tax=Vibrio rumoiensis 1S-45 TaxID=1188252 RepID=A0A1E5DYE7_9VIBR|nr:N-acetylglucosamine kinase [Vibrio rumoiensis]OEF22637.1 N-acetylglucosamine kinase [Vibrio rumoiensis 1S-45]